MRVTPCLALVASLSLTASASASTPPGNYLGETSQGQVITVTVDQSGNNVSKWSFDFSCSTLSGGQSSVNASCPIISGHFDCGTRTCSAFTGSTRVTGTFSGNLLLGGLQIGQQRDATPATCCSQDVTYSATLVASGPPAAPSGLTAVANGQTSIDVAWADNASNEADYVVEYRRLTDTTWETDNFYPPDTTSTSIGGLDPRTGYDVRVRAQNVDGDSANAVANATTDGAIAACVPSTSLCLNHDRFEVSAQWQTAQQSGNGTGVELTSDTGYFWFFNAANVELVIKVLDGCGVNGHYWIFAGGLTNQQVLVTGVDTQTGHARQYLNPLGAAFQPQQDTSAIAACP
jgi:hypothetical protein